MASFTIVTIEPPGYKHARAFDEIRLLLYYSLQELGHDVALRSNRLHDGGIPIILGVHLLDDTELAVLPDNCIIFNTEQLTGDCLRWRMCLVALSRKYIVWDYSNFNLKALRSDSTSCPRSFRLRLGFHENLQKITRISPFHPDFVFYGTITELRQRILDSIVLSSQLSIRAYSGFYGWPRDQILATCLAALNIHSQASRILEWPRILFLLANRIPCIALLSPKTVYDDDQLSYILSCPESDPMHQLETYFADPDGLADHASWAWHRFCQERQVVFTEQVLDQTYPTVGVPCLPHAAYPWKPFPSVDRLDAAWYDHAYPWIYTDPRDFYLFHEQEGRYRQYHPSMTSIDLLAKPVCLLGQADQSLLPSDLHWRSHDVVSESSLRIAVVLHFYHFDSARLFLTRFGLFLAAADFLVTTSNSLVAQMLEAEFRRLGIKSYDIQVIENVGRDIPSKYILFNSLLSGYDLCLFSHGKQSDLHWFHDHNNLLAGSLGRVAAIVDLFSQDTALGLVFPDYLESLLPSIGWGTMRSQIDALLADYGCDTSPVEVLEFPAGGFFWARPQALAIIHGLDLTLQQLPEEPLAKDGTILHALERMPCLSCEMMGLRWLKISRDHPP